MTKTISLNTTPTSTVDTKSWIILIALSIVWGSSFILMKWGLEVYSPLQVASLRIGISFLAFFPIFLSRLKKVDWSKWKYLLIVGLCGSGIPAFMFSIAQTQVSSSIAGILNSLTPLFTLVLGILFFGASGTPSKFFGVLLGLVGASLLILMGNSAGIEGNLWYGLLIVVAAICYGTSVNTVGKYLKDIPSLTINAVAFSFVGIPAIIYLFTTDFLTQLNTHPDGWEALGYIAILALVGTVLATYFFFMMVQWTSPLFSSMVTYLITIVAVIWGGIDGEIISIYHFLGTALILSGVYLSRSKRKPKQQTANSEQLSA